MYEGYFGLKKRPFVLTPDPGFLFISRVHDLALAHLEYGLLHNAGFIALTGEIGAGKTTLLKYLFDKVKKSQDIAMIFNTQLDSRSLLEMIAREFELSIGSNAKSDLLTLLHRHFIEEYARGKRSVIVVDEAQNLSLDALEELRMLSNLEADSDFLVQIILVGQPQLGNRLANPALAQLTQRISVYYHLAPLGDDEVQQYINHRLKIAGYAGKQPLFGDDAVRLIAEVSKGVPRVINTLCETSLTYAFADDLREVTGDIVGKVVADHRVLFTELGNGGRSGEGSAPVETASGNGNVFAAISADAQRMFSSIAARLTDLEMRMAQRESTPADSAVEVLQAKLIKEKERSQRLVQHLTLSHIKCRELQKQLELAKGRDGVSHTETRKSWKFWSRNE